MLNLSDYTLRVGAQGPIGPIGPIGPAGAGTTIKGTVVNYAALPTSGDTKGDVYLMQTAGTDSQGQAYAAGDGYVYTGGSPLWTYVGPIRGPVGGVGPVGAQGAPTTVNGRAGTSITLIPDDLTASAPWASSAAIVRKLGQKLNTDLPSVADLGASPSASDSYNAGAFRAAASAVTSSGGGFDILVPPGSYPINATVTLASPGTRFRGSSKGNTTLVQTTANLPHLMVANYAQSCGLADMTLDRSVTATGSTTTGEGGNGIETGDALNLCEFYRIISQHNWNGALLKSCAWGTLHEFAGLNNLNDGLAMTNGAGGGGVQWNTSGRTLLQTNGRDGLRVFSYNPGSVTNSEIILGELGAITTFQNAGYGFRALGSAAIPIHDIRAVLDVAGTDGLGEAYIDGYGVSYSLRVGFAELAGQEGVYSNQGPQTDAIVITANNPDGIIVFIKVNASGGRGLVSSAPQTIVCDPDIDNSGLNTALNSLQREAISLNGADSGIVGGRIKGATYCASLQGPRNFIIGTQLLNASVAPLTFLADTTVFCPGQPIQLPGILSATNAGIFDVLAATLRSPPTTVATLVSSGALYGQGQYMGSTLRVSDRNNRPAYMGADGVWKWVSGDVNVTTSN